MEFAGGAALASSWTKSKREELRYLLSREKGLEALQGAFGREGLIPRCAVKPRFQRERERERAQSRVSCAVDNKRDARHNSQRERTSPSRCKVNELHRTGVYTRWQQVYACTSPAGAKLHYGRAQLHARKICSTALSFRTDYFGGFSHATRFDWMRFDKMRTETVSLTIT